MEVKQSKSENAWIAIDGGINAASIFASYVLALKDDYSIYQAIKSGLAGAVHRHRRLRVALDRSAADWCRSGLSTRSG